MRALDIIRDEHRNMWRVARALGALGARLVEPVEPTDLHTIRLIIGYLDQFTERFHHPKEDDFLYARIAQRSNEAGAVLSILHRDHEMSPKQIARMKALADKAYAERDGETDADTRAALATEITSFIHHLGKHMRLEEDETFTLARATLTTEDWIEVDAAFAGHVDPLSQSDGVGEFALLRSRITQLLPSPEGLGAHADLAPAGRAAAPPRADAAAPTALEVHDLHSRYGRIEALHGVSLQVREGQLVALVGANGAGKTTILRCLSGVQPISGGRIVFHGGDISGMAADARVRAGICQVPEGRQVFGPMSIEDNLRMGGYTRPAGEVTAGLDEVFGLFPILKERRHLPAGTLSGGQQQMLALGRALMGKPKMMLLDEPSMGLAPLIVEEIFRIIRMLKDSGITILLVEQNARAALSIADHAYVLETGRVFLEGPGAQLLDDEAVRRAYLGM